MAEAAYISIDPGETSGWAKFDSEGNILEYGQFVQLDQTDWLRTNIIPSILTVIVEDYRNYNAQKRWSRNQTSMNIGAIQLMCDLHSIPMIKQPANIKGIGYKWAGLVAAPSNHAISHQFDAVAHGTYWLRQQGILKPSIPKD